MLGIDRQHQPVEETPTFRRRAEKKPVHVGCQPDNADMGGERRSRSHALTVDAAAARSRLAVGFDTGAEHDLAIRSFDHGGHRPTLGAGPTRRELVERGPPQATTGRKQ